MAIIPTDRKVDVSPDDSAPVTKGSKKKPREGETEVKLNKAGDVLVNAPELKPLAEQKSQTVAMLFGRMNPPTKGHEENIEGLKKLAKDHNADHVVIASHSHDGEKNPLSPEQKLKHLQRAFPDTNIKTSSKAQPTILHHAAELHKQGYKNLIVAGGGDRADEYHKLLNKYNGVEGRHGHYKFDSITVKSTGERKEGVSGSDMRKHVKSGNFDKFREGLPSKIRDNESHSKELFNDVKGGLKEYYERVGRLVERFIKLSEELSHKRDLGTTTLVKQLKAETPGEEASAQEVAEGIRAIYHKLMANKDLEEGDDWGSMSKREFKRREAEQEYEVEKRLTAARERTEREPHHVYINNKVWKKEGKPVEFGSKKHATAAGLSILKKDPTKSVRIAHHSYTEKHGGVIKEQSELDEAFLHDPDTYLRMATQAREQGKILRASLLTRIASAVRRGDTATAMTLRRSLPATQE